MFRLSLAPAIHPTKRWRLKKERPHRTTGGAATMQDQEELLFILERDVHAYAILYKVPVIETDIHLDDLGDP